MELIPGEARARVRPFGLTTTLSLTALLVVALAHQPFPATTRDFVIKPAVAGDFTFKTKELCLMERINKIRERHGLNRLRKDPHLGYVARQHAKTMAARGSYFHDATVGAKVTNWTVLGQNTGRAGSCKRMVRLFMDEPLHKENILGPWRWQGVGVKKGGRRYYFQHIFTAGGDPGNVFRIP